MVSVTQEWLVKQLNLIRFQPFTFLPFFLFIFFLYKCLQTRAGQRTKLPPSPPKLPVLGNLHQLGTYPHRSLRSLSQRYGDLMLIHLGRAPVLVVSSAKLAREIMKTQDAIFSNRPISKTGKKLLYNCKTLAAAPYGEYWRQMKSICVLQLLSNKRVQSFRSVREEETVLLMQKIEESAKSEVNLSDMFMTLTNDVICRVALGRKYSRKENNPDVKKILKEFLQLLARFKVGDFIPWLEWINRLSGWDAKVNKAAKEVDMFLEEMVEKHQVCSVNQPKNMDNDNGDQVKDFVDVLLDAQRNEMVGFPIERDSIKAIILDMFGGGTDTTYTVLEWAMAELLRQPKIMKELQTEVRGITKGKTYVAEDDLKQMKYLKAVIKETLRLHPPLPILVPRQSTTDTNIEGYDIPAGTAVIINAWEIHRDPALWEEPEKFHPERFLDSPIDFRGQDFQLIPFGSGRRICPGISFAIANDELVLANLMYKFDWMLPGRAKHETLNMSERIGLTIHRKTPLLVVASVPHCSKS